MRSILFTCMLLFVLSSTTALVAQELSFEGGKSITNFKFKNVIANSLENLQPTNQSYLGVGYRQNLFGEQVKFIGGLGVNSYGSVGSDTTIEGAFQYETTYLGIYAGLDIGVITAKRFSLHAKAMVAPELFMQGTQIFNGDVFNLKNNEDFNTPVIFLKAAASFEYKISTGLAAFFQFRVGQGNQLNKSESGAELSYVSTDFGLGLIVDLKEWSKQQKVD